MIVLGIETSCDETSASVIDNGRIASNIIHSQKAHVEFGGVVPELASRDHQAKIVSVVKKALEIAGISKNQIHAVAYTAGPGLMGSLLVGASFARAFAAGLNIPSIPVHHMQAHVHSLLVKENKIDLNPEFPFLCLLVSGGHTQIVLVQGFFDMEILGKTLDDAAGEAFDKTGKMLGLPYPAGPAIDQFAETGSPVFAFPVPKVPDLNFSFSGLKTSVLYFLKERLKKNPSFIKENLHDLCASVQQTIIQILMEKFSLAMLKVPCKTIGIAGGVSANSGLKKDMKRLAKKNHLTMLVPPLQLSTDNGAMIGVTGYIQLQTGKKVQEEIRTSANLPFLRYP